MKLIDFFVLLFMAVFSEQHSSVL